MEELTLAAGLTAAFTLLGPIVADKVIEYAGALPAYEAIKVRLQARQRDQSQAVVLLNAIEDALRRSGVLDKQGKLSLAWRRRLDKLTYVREDQLRRLVARHALTFVHRNQPLPDALRSALNWPAGEDDALKTLLLAVRDGLAADEQWRQLLHYFNEVASVGQQFAIKRALLNFDRLIVDTEQGEALRVQLAAQGLTKAQYERLEERYREALADEYRKHSFRGIAQFRKNLRLPLADIYVDLGMTAWHERSDERVEDEGMIGEELARQRLEKLSQREREVDVLATAQRVVLLADPGAGKSMTLEYIALMLALGQWQIRLGFDAPYLPLLLPLRDFAADGSRTRSLNSYLLDYVADKYGFDAQLKEFVRLALENGNCAVLLDGLDEVGDAAEAGQLTRRQVVERVQRFADTYCNERRRNRLIVTSRKEGYREAMLADVRHVEISALRPPEEIEHFLLRFYTALEQHDDPQLAREVAVARATSKVAGLLPQIMGEDSVQLLATNPLLLTILVLIYENVGQLPNRRVKLYHICAKTLIASWRQAQTDKQSAILQQLDEETVFNVMGRLAYWLHAHQPGGTALLVQWQKQLVLALAAEEVEGNLQLIAETFLNFCRFEAGLLSERGVERFGFFHLTFEEYLAGYAIAHAEDAQEQEQMLQAHWQDPRWREVILLAAGEVGIVMNSKMLTRKLLDTMLALTASEVADEGRAAVLAGRALHDIGAAAVPRRTVQRIHRELRETMQDWDVERNRPHAVPRMTSPVRHEAGLVLDLLEWLPLDLHEWVRCQGCSDNGGDLWVGKYPVTNAQFELFMQAGGYENPVLWGGEDSEAWLWRVENHNVEWRGDLPVREPEYWRTEQFGRKRRGFPVVGVSWYEAQAYCAWLSDLVRCLAANDGTVTAAERELVSDLFADVEIVRLLSDEEWTRVAGGESNDRYPWDTAGRVTDRNDKKTITARANVNESKIGQTSAVAQYPQGASVPFGLMDLAGNVWEWTQTQRNENSRWLRGGSWNHDRGSARVAVRFGYGPGDSNFIGFRVAAPVISDS
ncbi:MAG: SUMF1/EgtB/PvdO family nonheme iron enzyme [Anaerolineae bacterium]|nr:SUMF1/EgtB/PvdO family nonheme iron enzyme [Anaerolineae bacterium]MCO5193067.1 SUMF1/EgtB/PvdO family nonheme iron enzyme [Anaerolineae bacterium]MCO5206193.1 SUMF1/EgtB/PvdO family nonheme iron enzyme [Anaerolineae bacterium]